MGRGNSRMTAAATRRIQRKICSQGGREIELGKTLPPIPILMISLHQDENFTKKKQGSHHQYQIMKRKIIFSDKRLRKKLLELPLHSLKMRMRKRIASLQTRKEKSSKKMSEEILLHNRKMRKKFKRLKLR